MMGYMIAPGISGTHYRKFKKEDIIQVVCDYFNLEVADVISKSRDREKVVCRQFIFFFLKTKMKKGLAEVGRDMKKDHTTVLYGINKLNDLMIYDSYRADKTVLDLRINKLLDPEVEEQD